MADLSEWPPERLRALDVAVAEARGYTVAFDMPDGDGGPKYPWIYMGGDKEPLPEVSLGCRETFELQNDLKIDTGWTVANRCCAWVVGKSSVEAQSIPIAICLAYLAAKGVPFNG